MEIRVEQLHKSFGKNHVLQGLDLTIKPGDSLVILGGSGAGKSVLIRHIVGLISPDSGRVIVDSTDLSRFSRQQLVTYRRRIGFSFQDGALFDSLTAFENVAFPIRRHNRHWKENDIRDRVHHCLELVGMPTVGNRFPSELSGGMRRRVGFARAIAMKPDILLFDEPTTGLDPVLTSVLNQVILSLHEQLGATTVTITHDLSSARTIATRTAMLFQGRVIHEAEGASFFLSDNPIVRQFVEGTPHGPATETFYR